MTTPPGRPGATRPPGQPVPYRRLFTALGAAVTLAVVLIGLTDGAAAAGSGLVVFAVLALGAARYVAGGDAQDIGYRKSLRLMGSRAPALGEWRRIVDRALGDEGAVHFPTVLRPQLQRLYAARLAERHGVDLHRAPQPARALVGAELWPWLDPSRPPPRGELPARVLDALLDRLEEL